MLFNNFGVSIFQFIAGLFGGERPVDFDGGDISVGLPNQGVLFELLRAANTSVQVLAGEDRELDFGHVELGTVLGSIM